MVSEAATVTPGFDITSETVSRRSRMVSRTVSLLVVTSFKRADHHADLITWWRR